MNSIKKIVTKLARRSLIPHVLTSLTIIAACTLLFFTNTGCDMIKLLTTYAIQFSPPYFAVGAPGQQGVVQATLMWSSDDTTRELEAQTWTVDSGLPPILESATWSPKQNSVYTNITLKCSSDASRFGASDLWAASTASSYMLGVKASFVEPVWNSLSGGQKVVIARKAFLPLRTENPRVVVTQTQHFQVSPGVWWATFKVSTENPVEGWRYRVRAYGRDIHKTTGTVTNYDANDFNWQGAGGQEVTFPAIPSDQEVATYVVFEISYENYLGTVVRQERKVFSY